MFQVKQNESTASRKRLPILLVDATDGFTGETGVTSPTISISKNGATAASGTGSFVEIGQGQYYYEFASGEIDTLGWTSVYVIKTGTTRAYNAIVQIMAYDYAAGTNLGLSSLPTAAIGATGALLTSYTSNGALGLSSTGAVSNVANVASGLSDADTAGLRYRLGLDGTATAPSATGNLGANAGSVANVNGNIIGNLLGTVTGDVQGNVDGTVNAVLGLNGTAIAQIWDWASASIGATNSIGYQLKTNIDEPISSIDQAVWNYDVSGIGATNLAGGALEAAAGGTAGAGCSSAVEIAQAVWDYDLTAYYNPDQAGTRLFKAGEYVWTQDVETLSQDIWQANTKLINTVNSVYDANIPGPIVASSVWNYDISSLSSPGAYAGGYLIDISTWSFGAYNKPDETVIANAVWNFDTTGYEGTAPYVTGVLLNAATGASVAALPNEVWSADISGYTSPSAGYELLNAGAGSGGSSAAEIAAAVWDANVVGVGDTTSAAFYLANTLYTVSNVEVYVQNQTPQDVWTYSGSEGRTITGGTGVTLAAALPSNFSLLSINGSGQVTTSNPGTGASTPAEIASAVWSAATRTITGGTITTNSDKTGYSLTQAFPSNFSLLSINGSGQVTTSNPGTGSSSPTQIAQAVWGYNTGTGASAATQINLAAIGDSAATAKAVWDTHLLPYFVAGNSDIAGRVVYETMTQTDQIPQNVWDYDPGPYKTNGYASFGGVMWAAATGASAAQKVWNYNTGTGASAAAQLNAAAIAGSGGSSASEVAQAVWGLDISGYTSPSAGYDLVNVSAGSGGSSASEVAQAVWAFNTGTGASAAAQLNSSTAGSVWNYSIHWGDGNVAGYYLGNAIPGLIDITIGQTTNIAGEVFGDTIVNISGDPIYGPESAGFFLYNAGLSATSASSIAQNVWNYNTGTGASAAAQLNAAAIAGSGGSSAVEIADAVWSYDISTGPASPSASYYINNIDTSASSAAADASTAASNTSDIGGTVWSEDISGYTSPSAGYELLTAGAGSGGSSAADIATAVWNYNQSYSPGTAGQALSDTLDAATTAASGVSSNAPSEVWSYATRTTTGGVVDTNNDKTGYSLTQSFPTNFATLSINGSGQVTTSNPGTGSSSATEIAGAVWSAVSRTITGGTITTNSDKTGYSLTQSFPTNFATLSINGSGFVTSTNAGSGSSTPAEIANAVWAAATRTITGGTITTNSDKTGYSLTQAFPTNFATLSIDGSGQVTTSNPGTGSSSATEIASAVWAAGSRTVTGGSNITLASGQVPTNFTTLNIDGSGKVSVQAADISTIKSGLSTLTQAQVGTEVDSSLSDVGLTTTVTGRIDAAISSRLASASAPVNFSTLAINGSGEVTTSNPGTGASATQIASAVWTANRASIGASDGQFGYYLNAPVSAAGGTVTQVMLGPFALAATDGNNGYLNVFVDDERPVELVITDQNGNAIPLDTNNTHSVLVYDSGSTLVATYTGTVEYEAGGLVSFPLDADVTGTAGSYKVVFDIDNGLTISKYGGLTILVKLC